MEYKSQIIENLTPDLIQLGATNANPQVATLIVSKENENVSVGEIQGGTFISKFMVKSNSSSENQIVLQHSGNGVPIAGIGQESSHGSLQLRLNSGATQVRLSAINNNYIIPSLGVGGVTSPNAKLHIAGGSSGMFLSNLGNNSAYDSIKMSYTGYNSGTPEFCFTQTSTPGSGIVNTFYRFKNTNGIDGTNPNNVANVTIGGKLGVGTTNPAVELAVEGHIRSNNDSSADFLDIFCDGDGTGSSIISSSSNDIVIRPAIGELAIKANAFGNTGGNGILKIYDGSTAFGVVKVQLNSSGNSFLNGGNVGIGLTNPTKQLHLKRTTGDVRGIMVETTVTTSYAEIQVKAASEFRIGTGGSSTTPNGQFYIYDATAGAHRFDINALGNVGIGTISPLSLSSNTKSLTINSTRTDLTGALFLSANSVNKAQLYWDSSGLVNNVISGDTRFFNGGSERMRIESGGNVGIGTTSPDKTLTVGGTNVTHGIDIKTKIGSTVYKLWEAEQFFSDEGYQGIYYDNVKKIQFRANNVSYFTGGNVGFGATTSPIKTIEISYDSASTNVFSTLGGASAGPGLLIRNSNSTASNFCNLDFRANNSDGRIAYQNQGNNSGSFHFITDNNASIATKMFIKFSGDVGIGNTLPGYKLDVSGTGRFTSTVTATNFILSSDERLKENIKTLEPKVISAEWKSFNTKDDDSYRTGVIAQELEVKHPEFVETNKEGFKSVKYIDLLISKIIELEHRIKQLEK